LPTYLPRGMSNIQQNFRGVLPKAGVALNNIQVISVSGANALAELERFRAGYPSGGLYPILLGDTKDKDRVFEGRQEGFDASDSLNYCQTIEPIRWMEQRRELDPDLYQADDGNWPARADKMGIVTHLDIVSRKPKNEVFFALLKLSKPWESFAYLSWGGWNECPEPAVHCAFHRYWFERYGAEVVSMTGDIVQCIVARPPADRAASMELAREQYLYCCDIVEQGTQTIAALAAGLMDAKYWYFWWD
jgi:hypothetical protein